MSRRVRGGVGGGGAAANPGISRDRLWLDAQFRRVSGDGYLERRDDVRIFPGKDRDIGRISLLPGTRMRGRVVDAQGAVLISD